MEEKINTAECNNLKENGKCKIPHFYERIKYTSCNCSDIYDCYYKQLKRLEQENEEYKKQNALLLSQLIINDGEEVTVQISQSQFDEYNDLKQTIKELTQSLDDCNVDRTKLYKKLDFEMQKREEFADKSIKYQLIIEKIKGKWNEFKKLSPLEIGLNLELVYELDKAIGE